VKGGGQRKREEEREEEGERLRAVMGRSPRKGRGEWLNVEDETRVRRNRSFLLSPDCDSSFTMWLRTRFCSPESALVAVMSVFSEMFVRWPLYFSHGPAALMLSVVHLPATWRVTKD
jgi:hypothetical protein